MLGAWRPSASGRAAGNDSCGSASRASTATLCVARRSRSSSASSASTAGAGRSADPQTLLPGSGLAEHDFGPGVPRSLELEYSSDDFAAKHVLAAAPRRGGQPAAPRPAATSLARRAGTRSCGRSGSATSRPSPAATRPAAGAGSRRTATAATARSTSDDVDASRGVGPGSARRFAGRCRRPPSTSLDAERAGRPRPRPRTAARQPDARRPRVDRRRCHAARLFALLGMLPSVVYPAATLARDGLRRMAPTRCFVRSTVAG